MQLYDITIAAGKVQQITASGRYFHYYAGSAGGADNTITLKADKMSTSIVLKPGQSITLAPDAGEAVTWTIGNKANAATILGSVVIGDGLLRDATITGSVEVIDGGKSRTMAGASFWSNVTAAAGAGQFAEVQVWNPVGSGKRLFVEQIGISLSVGGAAGFGVASAQLATLYGGSPQKKNGSGAGAYQNRTDVPAALAAPSSNVGSILVPANDTRIYRFAEPLQIEPGNGFFVWSGAQNVTLMLNAEFFEESV